MARTLPIRLRTIAAAVVVIGSGLIIWNAYQSIIGSSDVTSATLPVIKADKEPFRVVPENPGGAEIPNQGSTLYNVLQENNTDKLALDGVKIDAKDQEEPETILDNAPEVTTGFVLPEIPERKTESLYDRMSEETPTEEESVLDREEVPAEERQELKEKLQQAIEQVESDNTTEAVEITDEAQEDVVDVTRDNNNVIDILPSRKPSYTRPIPDPEPEVVIPKVKKEFSLDEILSAEPMPKHYYIQLASIRGEDLARQTYAQIRDDFPSLVAGVSASFPQVDMGSRGVFTRIQIGPMSEAEARSRCATYTTSPRGGTCLVVSR